MDDSRCDESDLSEGELEELLNETMSEDEDESNVSSLSDDGMEGVHKFGNNLVNGGTNIKGKTDKGFSFLVGNKPRAYQKIEECFNF